MHRPSPLPPLARSSRARLSLAALLLVAASACAGGAGSYGAGRSTFLPPSRPAELNLGALPWGASADSATAAIEPHGYNLNKTDEDGDLNFDGILFRAPTRLYAYMGDQKLVKVRIFMNTEDEDALSVYQTVRAELTKQFGAPRETVEEYRAPYRKGDNKQLEAIRAGKAALQTHWVQGPGSRTPHVSAWVSEKLTVVVDYEGPAWEKESLRRRRGGAPSTTR
ncbi:MAG TPA: hypothetical protein VFJ74_10050 [Gemmatimonadaceae bacterium]|nr:hypothetical protein [Gemmatimonadaceae bacterium]